LRGEKEFAVEVSPARPEKREGVAGDLRTPYLKERI